MLKFLEFETINYILEKQNKNKNEAEISILVNETDDINLRNILLIANEAKQVNIVTNHIEKFKALEEKLLCETGIMLRVTNNYKRAICNSKIILNMDFSEELIIKYNLYKKAIIISLNNEINILQKKFSGIIIKDLELKIPEEYIDNVYKNVEIYESNIYKNKDFDNVREIIKKDKIEIENLIGFNGKINNKEIAKIA